ncbi:MAG: head-tail connector protein, partial [Clostridiales bacterium]|nr:head-tail connector protein [Clostridiales bacterium]
MELEELKLFLRIDGEEEDTLIKGLQIGAEEYLTNA